MALTLKAKLVSATIASIGTIAALVLTVGYGFNAVTDRLGEAQMVTAAVRNHTNADMMHDALKADVFAALRFASHAPERKAEIIAETREHAEAYKRLLAADRELSLGPDVDAVLQRLDQPADAYTNSAESLVAGAFDSQPNFETSLDDFERQFLRLEQMMEQAGDVLEAQASTEGDEAQRFAAYGLWLSRAALALGLLIGGFVLWVTHFDVLASLSNLRNALQKFADGDYAVKLPTSRKDEIGQIARTIQRVGKDATERNRLSRETRIMSELNEWLQSAKSEAELYQMIAEFLSRFLPECTGSLYVYANSRDVLECAKVWNGSQATTTMHPDDCWSLRRGRTYTHGEAEIEFDCAHVAPGTAEHYCCIPILAHGETIGLLHLEYAAKEKPSEDAKHRFAEQRRLGLAAVEHISLAIANAKLRDQLRDQSIRDVLTGLYNRRFLLETCRREFQRAARIGQPVAMLSIDVDHFKKFNDNHGHDAGDTVLKAVGGVLSATFRGDDIACRFGGEEFVVLLPGAIASAAQKRAEEIRAAIEAVKLRYADGDLPRITISVGVATYPEAGDAPLEVLKVADTALYEAKKQGRNRVVLANRGDAHSPHEKLNETILERFAG